MKSHDLAKHLLEQADMPIYIKQYSDDDDLYDIKELWFSLGMTFNRSGISEKNDFCYLEIDDSKAAKC